MAERGRGAVLPIVLALAACGGEEGGGTAETSPSGCEGGATEQPFTRTQSGVAIPDGVDEVVVEGRDLCNGYGGGTLTVPVPRSGDGG